MFETAVHRWAKPAPTVLLVASALLFCGCQSWRLRKPVAANPAPQAPATSGQVAPATTVKTNTVTNHVTIVATNTVTVTAEVDIEAIKEQLLETDNAFAKASEERGTAQAFYEYLAQDAISLPMGGMPIQGRDAIRVQLAAGPRQVLVWKPLGVDVSAGGAMSYTWGSFELRAQNAEGVPRTTFGKYVTIWKKQNDGSWKVVLHTSNQSPSPSRRR